MLDKELIESIVIQILEQMNDLEIYNDRNQKPKLLMLNSTEIDSTKKGMLMEKWSIVEQSKEKKEITALVKNVMIPEVTQDLFVKGALGITDTYESEFLSFCIRENLEIKLVPSESFLWILDINEKSDLSNYEKMMFDYKKRLAQFSTDLISWKDLFSIEPNSINKKNELFFDSHQLKLLTKNFVENTDSSEITISKSTIITPLARDAVRELNKNLKVI